MPYDDTPVVGYLRQAHDTARLSEREKHLVGLAVTMTRGCQVCTRNRIEKARAAGSGDDVLNVLVKWAPPASPVSRAGSPPSPPDAIVGDRWGLSARRAVGYRPRVPEAHAKDFRRAVDRCHHGRGDTQ